MFDNLKEKNIILASKSPRRRELLKELGVDFEIISIDGVEEKYSIHSFKEETTPTFIPEIKLASFAFSFGNTKFV